MKSADSIFSKLNPRYFWDVDLSKINETSACRLVIERVFSLGEIHEMNQVIDFYGKRKVIEVLSNLSYIDPKTLNFVVKLFNKPIEGFVCYQKQQLQPRFWNS